jgi:hypothetical protein
MAGAALIPNETASRAEAVSYALKNTAAGSAVQILNGGDGVNTLSPTNDITLGNWSSSTGYNTAGTPKNAIQVRTRRTADSPGGVLSGSLQDIQPWQARHFGKGDCRNTSKIERIITLHQDAVVAYVLTRLSVH